MLLRTLIHSLTANVSLVISRCIQHLTDKSLEQTFLAVTLLGNFGLLIIDHIHFQYNGIMFGILLISISKILEEKFLQSAFYFAVLLNMKHIFIYISPVFIVYLFKFYCCRSATIQRAFVNLLKLGAIVIGVTVISFGPFYDHIPQVNPKPKTNRQHSFQLYSIARCFRGCFRSSEDFVMHTGPRTFGLYTISPIKLQQN